MKININFYDNVGKLIQYTGHIKDDKLDYVVSPTGKRLSQSYGKRVYGQSQEGVTLLSEARGHKEEVPREYRHMLTRRPVMRLPPITGEVGFEGGLFVPYNTTDMDREIYIVFAANPVGGLEYWTPDKDEYSTFYKSTGYTNQMLKDDGLTLEQLGNWSGEKYIERGDQIVGYMFWEHDTE